MSKFYDLHVLEIPLLMAFCSKILLVLSKMDMSYRQMRNEVLLMLQIEQLKTQIPQTIAVAEFSAIDGAGMDKILSWLQTQ